MIFWGFNFIVMFLGHWKQSQQKNDLGKHKQLTLRGAFSNAKDASHVAEPRDNESDNDYGVDLDVHNIDIYMTKNDYLNLKMPVIITWLGV